MSAPLEVAHAINDARASMDSGKRSHMHNVACSICMKPYALECVQALANRETAGIWFISACTCGKLAIIKWLMAMFSKSVYAVCIDALEAACGTRRASTYKYLMTVFTLSPGRVYERRLIEHVSKAGMFRTTKWMFEQYASAFRHAGLFTGTKRCALATACDYGCQWFIRWLDRTYGISVDDVLANNGAIFEHACGSGELSVAQWMATRFDLTKRQLHDNKCHALAVACRDGHLHIVRWLVTRFGLNVRDVRADNGRAFQAACGSGRLELAQWLADRFQLTTRDARQGQVAIYYAYINEDSAMVKWLMTRFGLGREGSRVAHGNMTMWMGVDTYLEFHKWFFETVGLARHLCWRWVLIELLNKWQNLELARWVAKRFGVELDGVADELTIHSTDLYNRIMEWLNEA